MLNLDWTGEPEAHNRHEQAPTRAEISRTVPEGGLVAPMGGAGPGARHLYVHLPFCAHRCGYCDFVTVTRRDGAAGGEHGAYVDALLPSSSSSGRSSRRASQTVFLGGGTPTFTEPAALARLLAALPARGGGHRRGEPGDGHARARRAPARARRQPRLARARRASSRICSRRSSAAPAPTTVRAAAGLLRDAGFDNVSLDLIYGIPGQSRGRPRARSRRGARARARAPLRYELEAKPGTRFTHAHGAELERQAEALEDYFERVVATLTGAGYRWYETANFCRADGSPRPARPAQPRLLAGPRLPRARHRRRLDGLGAALAERAQPAALSLGARRAASGRSASSSRSTRRPGRRSASCSASAWTSRSRWSGSTTLSIARPCPAWNGRGCSACSTAGRRLALTERGRFLGGGVTAELLA